MAEKYRKNIAVALWLFASIFVTVAEKSASEATLKASAVNCAVLP